MRRNGNNQTSGGGIGFLGGLTLLFIALKLMGYITWSWWWVLSPLWIFFLFVVILIILLLALEDKRKF